MIVETEEVCGWCSRELVSLFDLDLSSPDLQGLGLSGSRLRVPLCERCTPYLITFAEVDLHGSCSWSSLNPTIGPRADEEPRALSRGHLALGVPRRTPLEARAFGHFVLKEGASQLGGFPTWMQDDGHPGCPRCRRPMRFVGQVDVADLVDLGEGLFYAFLCEGCGVAATTYQQT